MQETLKCPVGKPTPSTLDRYHLLHDYAAMTFPIKTVKFYLDARRWMQRFRASAQPTSEKLLPDQDPAEEHVLTLVLDLEETLISYFWTPRHFKRVSLRPGVHKFLQHMEKYYEIVVCSDRLPHVIDRACGSFDVLHRIQHTLSWRVSKYQRGTLKRDLSKLNRDPGKTIYVSAHAFESCLQPENCLRIKPYVARAYDDTALEELIPILESIADVNPADVRTLLPLMKETCCRRIPRRPSEIQR